MNIQYSIKWEDTENCYCPCLQKCCPKGYILKKNEKNGIHHGYDCQESSDQTLPTIPMKHLNKTPLNQKFYPGGFPTCEGLGMDWTYDIHEGKNFELEVHENDYQILHLGGNKEKNETIIGQIHMDPLMFFCFDQMEHQKSVVLTCPKPKKIFGTISKCCPMGQELNGTDCVQTNNPSVSLSVPINGHVYHGQKLDKLLTYDNKKVRFFLKLQ